MLTSEFDYELPEELIASRPLPERAASRMLVVDRRTGDISHRRFADVREFVRDEDVWVFNDSRVRKARLFTEDGRIEVLFVRSIGENRWECLVRPGKKMRTGAEVVVAGRKVRVVGIEEDGTRVVETDGPIDFEKYGQLAIPPYMKRASDDDDAMRYQTVYAREEGSVAAPTAGLHFTPELMQQLPTAYLTLHVGAGTFKPVSAERIEEHLMHEEDYSISEETAARLRAAERIVAVGTTATRVLESQPGELRATSETTSIFIHPPYQFRHVGAMLTNFHLPKSTLLMLVAAFAGRELVLEAYRQAVAERYRFYSYGDCMLLI